MDPRELSPGEEEASNAARSLAAARVVVLVEQGTLSGVLFPRMRRKPTPKIFNCRAMGIHEALELVEKGNASLMADEEKLR